MTAAVTALAIAVASVADAQEPAQSRLARGEYLAAVMDCSGCHTPGALRGVPDATRPLGGSDIGFHVPNHGVFYPPNLTSDLETGLGRWTEADIVKAVRTGVRPDGRILVPVMPYHNYAKLTDADVGALAAYLKSLPPIRNQAPATVGADEKPIAPYLTVVVPK